MTKGDMKRRDEAVEAFMRAFKLEFRDAAMLVDRLMMLGRRAQRNAENLCNVQDYVDKQDSIVKAVQKTLTEAGVSAKFKVGGDPRGYCLKIGLPDGSYNTWGGAEEGWGVLIMNDQDRSQWIDNDEGLYCWWKSSGLSKAKFINENRKAITEAIENVTSNKKPAHYLRYGG